MKIFKSLLFITLFVPQFAAAGFDLIPSLGMYKYQTDNDISSKGFSQLELRAGYSFEDFGLFLGLFYALGTDKFLEHTDHYSIGPMVGYKLKCGFYGLLGYSLFASEDLESGGVKYSSGTGMQVSIGHALPIMKDVYLGPEFTWKTMSYDKREVLGVSAPGDRDNDSFYPSITMWFKF